MFYLMVSIEDLWGWRLASRDARPCYQVARRLGIATNRKCLINKHLLVISMFFCWWNIAEMAIFMAIC